MSHCIAKTTGVISPSSQEWAANALKIDVKFISGEKTPTRGAVPCWQCPESSEGPVGGEACKTVYLWTHRWLAQGTVPTTFLC